MAPSLTTALDSALAIPEVRTLVLRHMERLRRDGLRQAMENSLGHRLMGSDFGPAESEGRYAEPPQGTGEEL